MVSFTDCVAGFNIIWCLGLVGMSVDRRGDVVTCARFAGVLVPRVG